jgi:hypothetical protein
LLFILPYAFHVQFWFTFQSVRPSQLPDDWRYEGVRSTLSESRSLIWFIFSSVRQMLNLNSTMKAVVIWRSTRVSN